jgi:hypothetical protein
VAGAAGGPGLGEVRRGPGAAAAEPGQRDRGDQAGDERTRGDGEADDERAEQVAGVSRGRRRQRRRGGAGWLPGLRHRGGRGRRGARRRRSWRGMSGRDAGGRGERGGGIEFAVPEAGRGVA